LLSPTYLRPPPSRPLFPYTTLFRSQPEAGAIPGTITLDELAEAFDHEIDGCYVGGTEFAVNVFAYVRDHRPSPPPAGPSAAATADRKSTRLNSSHVAISYAVFCLKK